ncbi:MAG: substrate-binding domain-containing protein [Actinobacteria bacterium]|nr:MAG: substrate-binding domain-containing protein [Actinomycetota bacterium]
MQVHRHLRLSRLGGRGRSSGSGRPRGRPPRRNRLVGVTLDRRQLLRRVTAAAGGMTLAGLAPEAAPAAATGSGGGAFPTHPRWKFVFVSNLTTSPLFVPLQYGIEDACALVECTYRWTGSVGADTGEVVKAVESARPVAEALQAGIPVVAYHADASPSDPRVAFVGQNAYAVGRSIGERIAKLVRKGDVTLFVTERRVPPVEQRLKGALAGIRGSGAPIRTTVVVTTGDSYESAARIDRHVIAHAHVRGLFALELVPSEGVGRAMVKHNLRREGVLAGGYGVLPATLDLIRQGQLEFTLDEQPYLQGFVPVLQLFLVKLSGGLLAPSDTELPLVFVRRSNLKRYLAKTRYEGSSSKQRYPIY